MGVASARLLDQLAQHRRHPDLILNSP